MNIKNAFIGSGNYEWEYKGHKLVALKTPLPCLILEDWFINDTKISVQLGFPYNIEYRPYKKDVICCIDLESRKRVTEVELKHYETYCYLSKNIDYKSIANSDDIDKAIIKYYKQITENKYDNEPERPKQQIKKQIMIGFDEESIIKRKIFLDTVDDIFGTIEAHLSYENDTRGKVKNSIHKKMLFHNELLKRVDSLVTTLQIFSLSCFMLKSRDDTDTLKLGKMACKQKLEGMTNHNKIKYKAFVDIMYYALDGNKIVFPERQPNQSELNPNFNSKNANDVLGQLIGGQPAAKTNRKKSKKSVKELKEKYDTDLKSAKNLPTIKRIQLPEMNELYKVFRIKDHELGGYIIIYYTFMYFSIYWHIYKVIYLLYIIIKIGLLAANKKTTKIKKINWVLKMLKMLLLKRVIIILIK